MDLITQIQNLSAECDRYAENMKQWGLKRARAEEEYQKILSEEVLKERDKGTAVGIINLTIKGKKGVAEKRAERDIAQTMYEVFQEKVNITKLQLRLLDSQAQREWSVAD